jgi:hypothetical protein
LKIGGGKRPIIVGGMRFWVNLGPAGLGSPETGLGPRHSGLVRAVAAYTPASAQIDAAAYQLHSMAVCRRRGSRGCRSPHRSYHAAHAKGRLTNTGSRTRSAGMPDACAACCASSETPTPCMSGQTPASSAPRRRRGAESRVASPEARRFFAEFRVPSPECRIFFAGCWVTA